MRKLTLIVPLAIVGVIAAFVAIAAHESDAAFVYRQQHPLTIEPTQMSQLIAKAREPVPGSQTYHAASSRCIPGRSSERRNPWTCTVHYTSGDTVVYRAIIAPSGSVHAADSLDSRTVNGCCIALPTE
jgi:hypothetical protein